MSKKKKIVLIVSALLVIILAIFTVVSDKIYQIMLPKVETFPYKTSISVEEQRVTVFLPEESIMVNRKGHNVAYKLYERTARFHNEYYVQEVQLDIYYNDDGKQEIREEDGYIRVIALGLEEWDNIVKFTDKPLQDEETVSWLNPETNLKLR